MKRAIMIGLFCALNFALWGQSITVTSPVAGAQWCQGSSHAITWTSSGVAGPLSIKLRLAGAPDAPPVMDIVASTANDGTESWLVPATLAPGNYLVRVRTVSDAPLVYDDSDSFEVKACSPAGGSITVTAPGPGAEWCQGTSYPITWTSAGAVGPVSIKLRPAGAPDAPPVLDIAASTANDGSESWLVPAALAAGDYVVRVRTVSESPLVYDDSDSFKIKVCGPPAASITVTSPTAGANWEQLTAHTITWTSSGVPGWVTLSLRHALSPDAPPECEIVGNHPNDGAWTWTVPEFVESDNYRIRVRTVLGDPVVIGDSPVFHIGPRLIIPHDLWDRKYIEVKWPPDPDPCLCPEWDIRELLERIRRIDPGFIGSLGLLKNGQKIMDLGALGGGHALANIVKPTLSRNDFDAFRKGTAKFSMGLFDAKGGLLQEIELKGGAPLLR